MNTAPIVSNPDNKGKTGGNDATQMNRSYEPKGVVLGQFLLFPALDVSESWNSNVYAAAYDKHSDFYSTVSPQFRLQSRFARNALEIYGQLNRTDYSTYTSDSRTGGSLSAQGRLDVTDRTKVTGLLLGYADHQDRGTPDSPASAAKPIPIRGFKSRIGISHQFNRLTLSGKLEMDRYLFLDVPSLSGGTIDENYRDRDQYTATEKAAYELIPGYSAVLQVSQNRRLYNNRDTNGVNRSSGGYNVQAGLGLDITRLMKGEILGGYMSQSYDDPALSPIHGYAMTALVDWTPTRTTLVVPSLSRTVQETTMYGASGEVQTAASVLVRHELRRNFILTAYLGTQYLQYHGARQDEWYSNGSLSLTYAFSRKLFIGGQVGETAARQSVDGGGFNQTIVTARVGLRL